MYSAKVLEYSRRLRSQGSLADATADVEVTNPVCGDVLTLAAIVREGRFVDVKFRMQGCVPAMACASWLTERVLGRAPGDLASLSTQEIETALEGLPPASHHASVLAIDALRALLEKIGSRE
jgi:NifU-like protein involved in Fe-S cluster formation